MDYSQLTDEDLARRLQENNYDALSEIIRRYQKKLFYYVVRITGQGDMAEDVVQETFLKVYENIQGFDVERKFSSWIYRIAHNNTINHLKKESRTNSVEIKTLDWLSIGKEEPNEDFVETERRKELTDDMLHCIKNIRSEYREVLELYFFENKSYEEISDILRVPETTVGVWLKRAKAALKKELDCVNDSKLGNLET